MNDRWYAVEFSLKDTGTPGAPHAYYPVTLTFQVEGKSITQAVSNAAKALKEISKIPGTLEKIELK